MKPRILGRQQDCGGRGRGLGNALIWIAPLTGLVLALALIPYQVDDAYISYRYAHNVAGGGGLAFNPGGAAVEGFSSPLWLMLLSAWAIVVPMPVLPFIGTAIGLLAFLGLLLVVLRACRSEPAPARGLAVLLLAVWPGAVFYAATGMETLLFVLCVTAFHLAALEMVPERAGLAAAFLSFWIRPEALWLPVALLLSVIPLGGWRRLFSRRTLRLIAALLAGGALLAALRWLLFAELLPNTFYAKLPDPGAGLRYVAGFASGAPGVLLLLLAFLGAWFGGLRHRSLALAGLAWMIAPALEGGDWMPHYRFLIPAVVLLTLAALGAARVPRKPVRWVAACLVLVAAGVLVRQDRSMARQVQHSYDTQFARELAIARWAREHEVGSLASVDIGAMGYYSQAMIVDVVGLTDRRVSRSAGGHLDKRFDLDYIFAERRPEAVILRSSIRPVIENGQLLRCRPGSLIEIRILLDPRLQRDYRLAMSMEVANEPRQSKLLFLRRDHPSARNLAGVSRMMFGSP